MKLLTLAALSLETLALYKGSKSGESSLDRDVPTSKKFVVIDQKVVDSLAETEGLKVKDILVFARKEEDVWNLNVRITAEKRLVFVNLMLGQKWDTESVPKGLFGKIAGLKGFC